METKRGQLAFSVMVPLNEQKNRQTRNDNDSPALFEKLPSCVKKLSSRIAGPPQSQWPCRRTEKMRMSMGAGAWKGTCRYHAGLGEEFKCCVPYQRSANSSAFWGVLCSMNHPPTSLHKHAHNLGLLSEGCSVICHISAHSGQEVSSLSSAICCAWGRLLCLLRFSLWISSYLTRGCLAFRHLR